MNRPSRRRGEFLSRKEIRIDPARHISASLILS
jgi:hypothetical protein